ncbi:calcium-binding protein [Rhizorhabdus argentea]|uniref:calcium-binding protein n=1 Tax=Rhizorhabdus argentea TaxID=1387174 RepID=UPI0030EE128A
MALLTTTYPSGYLGSVSMAYLSVDALAAASSSNRTSTSFTINEEGGSILVNGNGFSFDNNGIPTRGQITSVTVTGNGAQLFRLSGMQVSAVDVHAWLLTGDIYAPSPLLAGNDTLNGGASTDDLFGGLGHDVILGGANQDSLWGGAGNDHLYGQSPNGGDDRADGLYGGSGSDYIQGNAGNDSIEGGGGSDRLNGGSDNDLIYGDQSYGVDSSDPDGNDTVNGNRGDDTIVGGGGNDALRGGQGNDLIFGDGGNDVLIGDKGNDALLGGLGIDVLTGGEGRDAFLMASTDNSSKVYGAYGSGELRDAFVTTGPNAYITDVITDFSVGEDSVGFGINFQHGSKYVVGNAPDIQSAYPLALQLMKDNYSADNFSPDPIAAIQVGADTFLFAGTGASIETAVKLLNVSASELRDRTDGVIQTASASNTSLTAGHYQDIMTGHDGVDRFIFPADSTHLLPPAPGNRAVNGISLSGIPYDLDVIDMFENHVDKIYLPSGIGSGSGELLSSTDEELPNFASTMQRAQIMLDAHAGTHDVAVLDWASSTYLFYNDAGGTSINAIIRILRQTGGFHSDDFIGHL